jgi:hypothetical protein
MKLTFVKFLWFPRLCMNCGNFLWFRRVRQRFICDNPDFGTECYCISCPEYRKPTP